MKINKMSVCACINLCLHTRAHTQYKRIPDYLPLPSVEARPWVYKKEGGGAAAYEGYCVELSKKLSELMTFDFEFVFPADGHYGARQKNGSWNGLVGDLANGVSGLGGIGGRGRWIQTIIIRLLFECIRNLS